MAFLAQIVLTNLGLVALAAIILLGYLAIYLLSQRHLELRIEKLRGEWTAEIDSLIVKIRLERNEAVVPAPPLVAQPVSGAAPAGVPVATPPRKEIAPETLLVIAAAVTAYLGKKVRVRSAKMLYSHESFNAWSQQGRAVVQASHNVAQRVH